MAFVQISFNVANLQTGVALPGAIVSVYKTGTTTLASLFDALTGAAIANPLTADSTGLVSFKVVAGAVYDMVWSSGAYTSPRYAIGVEAASVQALLNATLAAPSSTTLTIATGAQTLSVAAGLPYYVGERVVIAASAISWMAGIVTAYSGTSLAVLVDTVAGSGSFSSWTVGIAGQMGPTGPANSLAIGSVTTLAPGASATAAITGAAPAQSLSLGIPAGATGAAWSYIAAAGGSVKAALAAALPTNTYAAGVLTASANGAFPTIDGVTINLNDRIFVWDYTGANGADLKYGIYTLTQVGGASTPWKLTRATDADTAGELGLISAFVTGGTANAGLTLAVTQAAGAITLGTTAIIVAVVAGTGVIATEAAARLAADTAEAALRVAGDAAIQTNYAPGPNTDRFGGMIVDANLKVTDYIEPGTAIRRTASVRTRSLNGVRPEALIMGQKPAAGNRLAFMAFMMNLGQSLAETHSGGGNITTTQPGKALAFGGLGSTTLYPLVSGSSSIEPYANDGENPMFGMCAFIYELLQKENGLLPADLLFTPVTVNNAAGGTGIAANNKGTTRYNYGIAQASALRTYAQANGQRARAFASGWYQGEDDYTNTFAYYYAALVALARDYNTDLRAVLTEQDFDHHLVTYQMCSRVNGGNRFSVARAQLQAALDYIAGVVPSGHSVPAPVGFSTPNYFMDHNYDATGVHIPARDSYWMGSYTGLYIKRVFIDGVSWKPITPVKQFREGNAVFLQFNMRAPGTKLVLANGTTNNIDGKSLPPQVNGGWTVYDQGASAYVTLAAVPDVVAPDTIRFRFSTAPVNGWRFDYGQSAPVNMAPFVGSCGNFRDNYGDLVFNDGCNRRMDNWLPIQSILLDNTTNGFSMA